jgi:hypothetical protein
VDIGIGNAGVVVVEEGEVEKYRSRRTRLSCVFGTCRVPYVISSLEFPFPASFSSGGLTANIT